MASLGQEFGIRRVYETSAKDGTGVALRLSDREIDLGAKEFALYEQVAERVPTVRAPKDVAADLGMDESQLRRLLGALEGAGLLYRADSIPASLNGVELHTLFNKVLPSWLAEAFSHPFWERMTSGKGSRRMYSGWLIELYHYTRNANRHMPLSCAHTREKAIKNMRAKHYAEEWNHYHYFLKALKALGFSEESVTTSVPLPMTLALSNFMRQAAREDIVAYSICSAVLEGTTVDRGSYNPYYEKCAELYDLPQESIAPIYAHLDLDVQYQHSDLFLDILTKVDALPAARAGRVLEYGHQLIEHIWMWTDSIEKYYGVESNAMPRPSFSKVLD
ncbi:MAG TPA: iron-containing redox enzyme family protein [Polyangia bacterium]|nr:iron-containing redox enzyme family protein [Polyangia bacterium]